MMLEVTSHRLWWASLNVAERVDECSVVLCADEPLKKPVPLHEQTVKDEKGRYKRFHGAFTGGFSAGYFNTVGSKEGGWSS